MPFTENVSPNAENIIIATAIKRATGTAALVLADDTGAASVLADDT